MEKRSLGKGIEALIPPAKSEKAEKIVYLKLQEIKPNPYQPRKEFNRQNLEELTQSIKEKGIIQPVLVRRKGDEYELIAGERRLRAANLLNIKEIPAIVKEINEPNLLELSLIENIQRQDLNPIEKARAFQYLSDKFGITQEQIAKIIGKSRTLITNLLRLLKLPQEIQEEIIQARISFAHGRILLELDNPNQQRMLAQKVIANSLSIKELENMVRKVRPPKPKSPKFKKSIDPYIAVMQEELQHILGTKVKISPGRKRGFIKIEFYSKEELERILGVLKKAKT